MNFHIHYVDGSDFHDHRTVAELEFSSLSKAIAYVKENYIEQGTDLEEIDNGDSVTLQWFNPCTLDHKHDDECGYTEGFEISHID